jgi:pimeloyl-ACP methyl ester carboxylesterase
MPTARSADGVQIAYTLFEKPEAKITPELGKLGIFCACGGESLRDFSQVISHPNAMMEMRGQGKSSRPESRYDYSVPLYAKDIVAVMDENKVRDGVVIAYSHGVEGAVYLAMNEPDKVKALVLIEPDLFPDQEIRRERLRLAEEGKVEDALRLTFSYVKPQMSRKELEAGIKYVLDAYGGSNEALIGEFRARSLFHVDENQLAHIQVPTLVIGGTLSSIRSSVARTARAIPGANVVWLKGADHFMTGGYGAKAAKAVSSFLDLLE